MAAKKTAVEGSHKGNVLCKAIDGSGNEISRQYHFDEEIPDDVIFDIFVDHFRPETHGEITDFTVEASE